MDKIFLIDKHTITYNDLIHYINGQLNIWDSQYTDLERFVLNTIKSLVSEPYIENHSHLIDVMEDTNGNIELKTSGTTGEPKIIYQSFEKMIRNIKLKDEDMVWGLFYSIDRMAGYQVLFQALLNKDTLVNMNGYDYKEIQQRILSYGVTHISATPTLYKMILDRVYPNVKQITFGGERSSKEFHHNISKYFPNARVKNIYASTEAGSLFASNGDTFTIPKKFMDKIRIKNDEIWLHKDIVGDSFHMKWEGNWYNTGDLVTFVNRNEFKIIGRSTNIVKIGGYNVNLELVESKIQQLDGVKLVKITSKENSVLGNILIGEIIHYDGYSLIDIKRNMKNVLDKWEIPTKLKVVESIELTENGKIKR